MANYRGLRVEASTHQAPLTYDQRGLFADLRQGLRSRACLSTPLIQDIIRTTKRAWYMRLTGYAFYAAGLVGGFYLGNLFNKAVTGDRGADAGQASGKIATGGTGGPASLLFSNVTFPFMTRYSDGSTTGKAPTDALRCAAVNGGMILGVAIDLNRS